VIGCNTYGKEVMRKMLKRANVMAYFANLPACVIAMEACAGAHFWGRTLRGLGHEVRLSPPQHVKAYVRGNKNDYNDVRAIAKAAQRPDMRFLALKAVEQHRLSTAAVLFGYQAQGCRNVTPFAK
jgi:transposase